MKKLTDDIHLKELRELLKSVDFGAFPGREKRNQLNCHPKFQRLFDLINNEVKGK